MKNFKKKTEWHSGNRIWRRKLVENLDKYFELILTALLDEGVITEEDLTNADIDPPDTES